MALLPYPTPPSPSNSQRLLPLPLVSVLGTIVYDVLHRSLSHQYTERQSLPHLPLLHEEQPGIFLYLPSHIVHLISSFKDGPYTFIVRPVYGQTKRIHFSYLLKVQRKPCSLHWFPTLKSGKL